MRLCGPTRTDDDWKFTRDDLNKLIQRLHLPLPGVQAEDAAIRPAVRREEALRRDAGRTSHNPKNTRMAERAPVLRGHWAFYQCYNLTNVTIGNNVTSIGEVTFAECSSLAWVTLGKSITYLGLGAFQFDSLQGVFFEGGPPQLVLLPFYDDSNVIFYYLPGVAGWSPQVVTGDTNCEIC